MSRRNLRSQVDVLREEKERLEAENARLQETLQAEVNRLRKENERLQEEKKTTPALGEIQIEEERGETEKLLEEQRQLYEDLQAELSDAVDRGNALEDKCSSLEDKLLQIMEESEVERLKAVDAVRSRYEETLLPQMQELQRQVQKLQESQSPTSAPGDGKPVEPDGKPVEPDKHVSKETTGSTESTGGADPNKTTDSTQATTTATAHLSDKASHTTEAIEATGTQHSTASELSTALLAQQLPPLPKYSGSTDPSEETFQEWVAQFELMAEVCKWTPRAKLIHLTTRLRGEAFAFYRSCSKQQKADYDVLVQELTRRFTPVRIQSVQTSLFHDRKQGDQECVDSYAQDLKARFYKAYPQVHQGSDVAESMGKSVLASQFVAGLKPALKSKVAGTEGGFDEVLVKARFEEAKLRDLNPRQPPRRTNESSTSPTVTFAKSPSTERLPSDRPRLLECKKCGGTNHVAKYCRWRGRTEPAEAGGKDKTTSKAVKTLVHQCKSRSQLWDAELDQALTDISTTMHTITLQESDVGTQLGPTLTSEVQFEGCPVKALLDTGSPSTIVALDFLLETLAKQRKPEETPQEWRARVEQKMEPPTIPLCSYSGQKLNILCQITVDIIRGNCKVTAKVQVQKGAPVPLLVGTDLLSRLGFALLESGPDNSAVECSHQRSPAATVKLITATRVPARHTKIVKARMDGVEPRSTALLDPGGDLEQRGLMVEGALLQPDGEHCVCIPIQNLSCGAIELESGVTLGRVQPVTVMEHPWEVTEQMGEASEASNPHKPASPSPRDTKLLESIHLEESLSPEQAQQLNCLVLEFCDVFAIDQSELGTTDVVTHVIDTGDSAPIKQPPRRIPFALREKVDQLVKEMLDQGVVTPSKSPWGSPVVLVAKKDGSTRFCVDYRRLNAATKPDVFPLPRVDDSLDQLSNSKYFTTLDLAAGYWQVLVDPPSREKTAFVTHSGLFEFSVMPFGLKNAPATFQRLMETVLAGLIRDICLDYLDDIIVTGRKFDEHLANLRKVLTRLREAGLKLKPPKCFFAMRKVEYLGYHVSGEGISADLAKIQAVQEFPRPKDLKQVRSFLGLASYYRRFIPLFSRVASPLYALTRKDVPFEWSDACENAFTQLKMLLTQAPILAFPNFAQDFHLETDASGLGLGAVLSQEQDNGAMKPLAYASRTLQQHEKNYGATEMEALGVVWAIRHFRQYLYGHRCHVHTDHEALKSLLNSPHPSGKLARWGLAVQELDLQIHYKPGRCNQKADALSRSPCPMASQEEGCEERLVATVGTNSQSAAKGGDRSLGSLQRDDPKLLPYFSYLEDGILPDDKNESRGLVLSRDKFEVIDGILYHVETDKTLRVIPPESLRRKLFDEAHGGQFGGHLRDAKMHSLLSRHYWWQGMRTDICRWCRACITCATRQTGRSVRPPLIPIPVGGPFDRIGVDVVQFPKSARGNKYAIVFVDYLTKWVEVFPTPDQSALTIARLLVSEIISRHGVPRELLSDRGAAFLSKLLYELYRLMGIHKVSTTAYHPQTDGLVERFHRTLTAMLSKTTQPGGTDWDERLPFVLFAYRCCEQESTRESPFFMLYGRDPVLPTEEALSPPVKRCYLEYDDYRSQVVQNLSEAWAKARQNVRKAQKQQKRQHDRQTRMPTWSIGDRVFVYMPAAKSGKAYKLSRPFHGPYRIITMHDNGADVRRVDRPQDATIRVPFARLRVCPSEIPDVSWPPKNSSESNSAAATTVTHMTPTATAEPQRVIPAKNGMGVWKGRLRERKKN